MLIQILMVATTVMARPNAEINNGQRHTTRINPIII